MPAVVDIALSALKLYMTMTVSYDDQTTIYIYIMTMKSIRNIAHRRSVGDFVCQSCTYRLRRQNRSYATTRSTPEIYDVCSAISLAEFPLNIVSR